MAKCQRKNKSIHLIVQLHSLRAVMELSREKPMHNTIDERIAETGGNFPIEMKILNLIGCVRCPTVTDATDLT